VQQNMQSAYPRATGAKWIGIVQQSFRIVAACSALLIALSSNANAQTPQTRCPQPLATATQLLVVTTPTINDATGRLETYRRQTTRSNWQATGSSIEIVIGLRGLAWGWTAKNLSRPGEPMKREGDKRTPAGIFELGRAFGSKPANLPNFLTLKKRATFCVDDTRSRYYGQIVHRSNVGSRISGEDMATINLYRRGIIVNYPPNAAKRAGSCIFIHVWRRPGKGTVGCIGASESNVQKLQTFTSQVSARSTTAIAILPENARSRLGKCLPEPQT